MCVEAQTANLYLHSSCTLNCGNEKEVCLLWGTKLIPPVTYLNVGHYGWGGQSPAFHRGCPCWIPGQCLRNVWWAMWHCDRLVSRYLCSPVSNHSTIAPDSPWSACCHYQKDKLAKPGDLPKSNALSELQQLWVPNCFHFFLWSARFYCHTGSFETFFFKALTFRIGWF
jgi:hypothetical protein